MTSLSDESKSFIRDLWHTYLITRSYEGILGILEGRIDANFVLIGMGADEIRIGLEDAANSMQEELNETKNLKFEISEEWYKTQEISDDVCIVFGGFSIREQTNQKRNLFSDIDSRFTAVCVRKEGKICVTHIHNSVPNIFQTPGEFFPKFLNDRANEILQEEIEKKTNELEKLNEEFIEQEELYRVAISASDDIIVLMDIAKQTAYYDKEKIQRIYDIPVEAVEIEGFFSMVYSRVYPEDKLRFSQIFNMNEDKWYDSAWYSAITEPINTEYRIKHDKFGYMWICNSLIPIRDSEGKIIKIVSHIKNINEQKRREQELHGIAIRDGLTNLYNKIYTEQSVAEMLKNPDSNGALFMIDIDNFKSVNDTVGHLFADDVLKMFANILLSVFREDDIVGRFGGDEFIAYMKYKDDMDIIRKRAEEIIRRFDSYLESLGDTPFKTSCSVGVSLYPKDGEVFSELYKNADDAMYASKAGGKHKISFFQEETSCGGGREQPSTPTKK